MKNDKLKTKNREQTWFLSLVFIGYYLIGLRIRIPNRQSKGWSPLVLGSW